MKLDFSNRYRIVEDNYLGFEVQVKRWFFPFWSQVWGKGGVSNTYTSIEEARKLIDEHKGNKQILPKKEVWRDRK